MNIIKLFALRGAPPARIVGLGCWVIALSGSWVVAFLGCCVLGLLLCWAVAVWGRWVNALLSWWIEQAWQAFATIFAPNMIQEWSQNGSKYVRRGASEAKTKRHGNSRGIHITAALGFGTKIASNGSKIVTKMEPKSIRNRGWNRCKIDDRFWYNFDWFLIQKWTRILTKCWLGCC